MYEDKQFLALYSIEYRALIMSQFSSLIQGFRSRNIRAELCNKNVEISRVPEL